ncbi:hypothetical protein [Intestinibacillus sp. Marseille-P6563]|uniref:hypothetical protein n=1 Tax=Intestinibacillus sp. Marseille-P6563 TaxID=2364792 RepID=UPI000F069A9E|nr:hypothetical protein [Intestinibacillus sp. Marseille-P6563]
MDVNNVKEIADVTDYQIANQYISLGWVYADKYVNLTDSAYPPFYQQQIHYVLLWSKDGVPIHPPSDQSTRNSE